MSMQRIISNLMIYPSFTISMLKANSILKVEFPSKLKLLVQFWKYLLHLALRSKM